MKPPHRAQLFLPFLLLCWIGLVSNPAYAKRHLVVLDPGHGGTETGTANSEVGVQEKELVLTISNLVKKILQKARVEVRMTRADDRTLSLRGRTELANRLGASAFVSLHLNYAPKPSRRGFETYVLSAEASDAESAAILRREEGFSQPKPAEPADDLSAILGDLSQAASVERSLQLAKAVQNAAKRHPGLAPSRGLRQAPFTVLSSARVPAVLVEMGYLSNEEQARFFGSARGQREAAKAIAEGILRFLRR